MTTKPASVTKRPGHLRVGKHSLIYSTSRYFLAPTVCKSNSVSGYVLGLGHIGKGCKKFFFTLENVYYMDGNYSVWETDIVNIGYVIFDPVCTEKGRVVNFRKLHKLEWVFG